MKNVWEQKTHRMAFVEDFGLEARMQNNKKDDEYVGEGIETPHDHDVLSGRGNFVNYHPGNEHFRALVRKHKVAYVACPKPQKGKFSKMIFDEIQSRNPPGRFLKQHPTTKLWYVIGEKKALDKTRQALREGAPDIQKELVVENSPTTNQEEYNSMMHAQAYHHMPDLHSSPVKMAHHIPMMRGAVNQGFQHVSPTRYDQYVSSLSPLPPQHHHGFMPMMQQAHGTMNHGGRDIMVPALFPPPFQNQSLQKSPTFTHHSTRMQDYGQQHQQIHVTPGSHTVRPSTSQMNMPIPNMNTSSPNERPRWEVIRSISLTEENDEIAPLASESKYNFFSSKYGTKDSQDYQASMTSLDVGLANDQKQSRSKFANSSQRSLMSLSVDGMGTSIQDLSDTNYLSALFNNSLRINGSKPSAGRSNNMASSSQLAGTMEMSVNTLEGDQLSDFGDSAMMKMSESQADMSFGNVFEDHDRP